MSWLTTREAMRTLGLTRDQVYGALKGRHENGLMGCRAVEKRGSRWWIHRERFLGWWQPAEPGEIVLPGVGERRLRQLHDTARRLELEPAELLRRCIDAGLAEELSRASTRQRHP